LHFWHFGSSISTPPFRLQAPHAAAHLIVGALSKSRRGVRCNVAEGDGCNATTHACDGGEARAVRFVGVTRAAHEIVTATFVPPGVMVTPS